ncbi:MAG: 30S ribosomal protein S4 [Bacteroidales bacterium OttesenSCG-928-I14]|jgi:small subunit ribosomal protein S4|nr:30S ribosomal protein S4 [Bacteroidales bacterium OttesenSCG-928-I14]
MARYIGAKAKIARKFGDPIFGMNKALNKSKHNNKSKKNISANRKKKKRSEYGIQLSEKQKAKYTYGLLEKQFHNLFVKASQTKGITGEVLLQLLESRLDNLVYRIGLASTRAGARQLISHRHILVDDKIINIPSYSVKLGQIIGVHEKAKSMSIIINNLIKANYNKYSWIEYDKSSMNAKYLRIPDRVDIPENIKEQLIVELYSK